MSDLISRSEVLDILQREKNLKCGYDADIAIFSIEKQVRELSTAYDVDAVVKDIREYAECDDECAKTHYLGMGCKACVWNTMMDLVRKGGGKV